MVLNIASLPRELKKCLILVFDFCCLLLALTLATSLRMGEIWPEEIMARSAPLFPVMAALGIAVSLALRIPNIRLSGFDPDAMVKNGIAALTLAAAGTILNVVFQLGAPRTVPPIFGLLFFALSVGGKLAILKTLNWLGTYDSNVQPVAIYGAGSAGLQLVSALRESRHVRVMAIVDDNPATHGVIMGGLQVGSPEMLGELARAGHIGRILIAMPSASEARRAQLVRSLSKLPCEIQIMPGYAEIIEKGGPVQALRAVSPDDLLGRGAVDMDTPEIELTYDGRSILITGAGGSIGSELCRQMMRLNPSRVVLFEQSEYALYAIERELRPDADAAGIELVACLGSVTDRKRMDRALSGQGIEIVLHAAAYKHVPLIEDNELEGVRNNVFGTQTAAEAAEAAGVERFILISTDKAVRPTNVMGATKRMAEMVIQDLQSRSTTTKFSMVRFGNVLGSSGSVIPLFREQIATGGPVTLTDPEVTRYFMTIPEAARLVLLAGAYANGGETFVLDMGEPVKIVDLARQMIELSGFSVRDLENPDGDIEIEVIGLRPGEKLYEELLIADDKLLKTPHPKILLAHEVCPSELALAGVLRELSQAIETGSGQAVRTAFARCVEGYSDNAKQARSPAQ